MKLNSYEIDNEIFNKQMSLYLKIDNLINKRFDELEPDILSILTRTLMDLDDRIQVYKKGMQNKELYSSNTYRYSKEKVGIEESKQIRLNEILKELKISDF